MAQFNRSIAIIIGINQYQNGVPPLTTAVNDASDLSQVLKADHGYQVVFMRDHQVTLASLKTLLVEKLPTIVQPNDRVLFYFAGHGLAFNGDAGPEGYLIPQDATLGDSKTYLPMTLVHDSLTALACRHFLGIFDCCFAGAFRWSATRRLTPIPKVIHKERFDRFLTDPAWQVLTSAADDQEAMDALSLKDHRGHTGHHSPFAEALIQALKAESQADASPPAQNGKPAGDGVITATELYQYLRDAVEPGTLEHAKRQTPGLWPLKKHGKGEYIFLVPGRKPDLPEAPKLDEAANPYRGLESFEEVHQHLFFGRKQLIQELQEFVESHALTVVLGASGTGKSSVVKAGLVPALKQNLDIDGNPIWQVLPIVRPGVTPLKAVTQSFGSHDLGRTLANQSASAWGETLKTYLQQWQQQHPNQKLLLVIDQAEELFSLCREGAQRQQFLEMLAELLEQQSAQFHILLTLRSDFEPQFRDSPLEPYWGQDRFLIRPMNREELRAAIEAPASAKVMYFDPPELVDRLIDEVNEMPGALPLLSFTLRELFLKYLRNASTRSNRAITEADYEELGGIKQALVNRAEEEYRFLVDQDPAFADTVRHVMLRMVASGGTGNTRRQVLLSELDYAEPEGTRVKEVLARYKQARLLVSDTTAEDQPYVEPAHDALVEGWPRLLQWLESGTAGEALGLQGRKGLFRWLSNLGNKNNEASLDEREKLLLQRRLTPAANDWQREQKTKFLWHADARLPLLKQIRKREPDWFNKTEGEFVERSLGRKSFNVRLRWLSMTGLLAASVVAGLVILRAQQEAIVQRNIAEDNRVQAEKRNLSNLTSNSKVLFESEQNLESLLNAIKAARIIQDEAVIAEDESLRSIALTTIFRSYYGRGKLQRYDEIQHFPGSVLSIRSDASMIATLDNGNAKIWNISSGKNLLSKQHQGEINRLVLLPEMNQYLTIETFGSSSEGNEVQNLKLWSIESGEEISFTESFGDLVPPEILQSAKPLVLDTLIRLLSLAKNNQNISSFLEEQDLEKYSSLILSPNTRMISGIKNGSIYLFDLESGNTKILATKTPSDGLDLYYESKTLETKWGKLRDPDRVAEDIAFSSNGEFLLSTTFNEISIWSLEGELIKTKEFDTEFCNTVTEVEVGARQEVVEGSVRFIPNNDKLIAVCKNGNLKGWDNILSETTDLLAFKVRVFDYPFDNLNYNFSELSIDPSKPIIGVSNTSSGRRITKVVDFSLKDKTLPASFPEVVHDFDFSPKQNYVAKINQDGRGYLWNKESVEIQSFPVFEEELKPIGARTLIGDGTSKGDRARVVFSPSGELLAFSAGREIKILDLSGNLINEISYPEKTINLSFSMSGNALIVVGEESSIGIWRFDGSEIDFLDRRIPYDKKSIVNASAISPNKEIIGIATSDGFDSDSLLQIIDIKNNSYFELTPKEISVSSLDFTPDSERLLVSSDFLEVWDLDSKKSISRLEMEGNPLLSTFHRLGMIAVSNYSFQNAGKIVVTDAEIIDANGMSLVDINDTPTTPDEWLGTLNASNIEKVIFSEDGSLLGSLHYDSTGGGAEFKLVVWDFDLDTLVRKACDYLDSYLNSPTLDEEDRNACDFDSSGDAISGNSSPHSEADVQDGLSDQVDFGSSPNHSSQSNTSSWFSPRRWLKTIQGIRLPSIPSDNIEEETETGEEPAVEQVTEQAMFQQLHSQVAVWDMDGTLDSLRILKASDEPCVTNFATEFVTALNQQSDEGFRQINLIKEELNETQGCKLPLVPFEFSPLSGD